MPPEIPTYTEVCIIKWVAKWIMLPVALVGTTFAGIETYKENRRCEEICQSNGYQQHQIESKGKYSENEYICTEKLDQSGHVDNKSKFKIDLN